MLDEAAEQRLAGIGIRNALWIGASQILALLAGISREGGLSRARRWTPPPSAEHRQVEQVGRVVPGDAAARERQPAGMARLVGRPEGVDQQLGDDHVVPEFQRGEPAEQRRLD